VKTGYAPRALGSVAKVISGQSPEGKFYNVNGEGLPFYQGKKEFGDRHIGPPTTWTTEVTKIAEPGDILMSVRAPVGPVNFTQDRICIGRGLAAIRTNKEISPDFLFYQLLYKQDEIAGTEGAVFASINKAGIESVQIVAPSREEQFRIVTLLDEAFADIASAKANAEKNLQNARELFESHLDAIITNAQASGEIVPLSELATDITDGDHMPPPKVEQGLPFITIGNIDKQTRAIDFTDTFQVPREYFDGLKANKKPKRGDVLYTVTGSFGIPVLVEEDKEFCFQRHIGLIRPKADVDSIWLHYLLQSPQVFNQASDGATGTAQKTVSLKVLRNLQVPKISPREQLAQVDTLRSVEIESRRLESIYRQKLTALDALKKSLLHQAFSGQL
jgi:type I restriction enzyme S subunit